MRTELSETLDNNALSLDLPHTLGASENWRNLTHEWTHFSIYASEPYLRESIADADIILGHYLPTFTKNFASLLIKPDAIVGRRATVICDHLRNNKFRIIYTKPFRFDRLMIRELWRYSMNISTNEKFELVDKIHAASQSIYLLLEDQEQPMNGSSAAVRLQKLKGSAFNSQRAGTSIRSVAKSPNEILVLVHTPDEPLEMLRELGLLFDRKNRNELFREARKNLEQRGAENDLAITTTIEHIESTTTAHELDTAVSTQRVLERIGENGKHLSMQALWSRLKDLSTDPNDSRAQWDSILIGTAVIDLSITGMRKLIE